MIKTGSIYDKPSPADGLRVLVMRYWPRGVRKEACDLWLKDLGPSTPIIRAWKDGTIDWPEFRKRYLAEYKSDKRKSDAFDELKRLIRQEKGRGVTLLCSCKDERCHRFIIQELLKGGRGR